MRCYEVLEQNPSKQGLKQEPQFVLPDLHRQSFRAKSIKTRIETQFQTKKSDFVAVF